MKHMDFVMGKGFTCGRKRWLCTDTGRRTVSAIEVNSVQELVTSERDPETGIRTQKIETVRDSEPSDFFGPPYKIVETVFDENDMGGCEPYDVTELAYFKK